MGNIAELGHLWRSSLDDELRPGADPRNAWWRTVDLLRKTEGTMLLDAMTVRGTSGERPGLVAMNARQPDVLRALFHNLRLGISNVANTGWVALEPAARDQVISELLKTNCISFTDLFTDAYSDTGGGGPLASAFRSCAPGAAPNDIYEEDAFRAICELVSFRHNAFQIVLAVRELCGNGVTVSREERALATLLRDAYTGEIQLLSLSNLFSETSACATFTRYVDPAGGNRHPYTNWADAAWTIQDALDTAVDGDTVLVQDGLYPVTAAVAVVRGIAMKATGTAGGVTLRGGGQQPCLTLAHTNASVEGFTITGGVATNGGGVMLNGGTLRNCLITGNRALERGGGVYAIGGGRLQYCTVSSNKADRLGGGLFSMNTLRLENTIVAGNTAGDSGDNWYSIGPAATWSQGLTAPRPGGGTVSDSDPRFVNSAGNFRLRHGSAAIDAAVVLPEPLAADLDGRRRPADGNLDGRAIADIGVYEYRPEWTDSDGDGYTDAEERAAGTNPLDADSRLALEDVGPASGTEGLTLGWQGADGQEYAVYRSTNLTDDVWTLATNVHGADAWLVITNAPTASLEYYRLRLGDAPLAVLALLRALTDYRAQYGEFPWGLTGYDAPAADIEDNATGIQVESGVVRMLGGENINGRNPSNTVFIAIQPTQLNAEGAYVDPWGNPYKYMCDYDGDDRVKIQFSNFSTTTNLDTAAAVWSRGSDGSDEAGHQDDDVTTW